MLAFLLLSVPNAAALSDEPSEAPTASRLKASLVAFGADSVPKRAVVGGAAGMIAGAVLKSSQNMLVNSCLLGGAAVGVACYAGWVKPEDLVEKADGLVDAGSGYFEQATRMLLGSVEPIAKAIPRSKATLANLAKKLPGLMFGVAFGALLGYRIA